MEILIYLLKTLCLKANVFDINRIGEASQVEGGESLSLGLSSKAKIRKVSIF